MDFNPDDIIKAAAGDVRIQNRIYARLRPILRGYFMKRVGNKSEVGDLIQNTLMRVHRSLPALQKPDRFKAFAMKAALFELQDLYRGRYGPRETIVEPDSLPERSEKPEDVGLKVDLDRFLDTLSPKARKIIELRQFGYRYEEIAEMLQTTEAAVKMQVKRSFDRLRVLIQKSTLILVVGLCYFWNLIGG